MEEKYEVWTTKPMDPEEPLDKIAVFFDEDLAIEYTDLYFNSQCETLLVIKDDVVIYSGGDNF